MFKLHGLIAVLILVSINTNLVAADNFFAGLRKPPQGPNSEYDNYLMLRYKNVLDDLRRLSLQQQIAMSMQNANDDGFTDNVKGPGFTYKMPIQNQQQLPSNGDIPFAVGPGDPAFFEQPDNAGDMPINSNSIIINRLLNGNIEPATRLNSDGSTSYKIKAPMRINPRIIPYEDILNADAENTYEISKSMDVTFRQDVQKKFDDMDNGKSGTIINLQPITQHLNDVAKKPVDLNSAWVIAVIAGVSAAFTVGLLAIGIGWYTLQKKAKAAADVDYPAYGITGPNKDISPSMGDRRLAQSAQMYHYQHQKNQIIAMENQNNEDQNCSISDIETDEENEEGDYTVYECPGLAPTGDMEVKNPLFLDDPTPVKKEATTKPQSSQMPQPKSEQSNDNSKTVDSIKKK